MKTNKNLSKLALGTGGAVLLSIAAGCAHEQPPRELVDARNAYHRAETSHASQLAPASVHEAHLALERAERLYHDDAESAKTRDSAYIAQRRAQRAEVEATTIQLQQQNQQSLEQQRQQAAQAAVTAQDQLEKTRGELDSERAARQQAEMKAREALDKLQMANTVAVKDEPRGTVLTLPGSVLFTSGKAVVLPGAQERLDKVAEALKNDTEHNITVEGHTDSRGSYATNQQLSQQRAEAVRSYLVSKGLPEDRVKAVGVGATRPIADNDTAEGRATNRRVEIVVESAEQK